MEITTPRHARLTTLLGFLSMILVWGSFTVVAKIGTEHAPPLFFSSTRFLLAFCLMIPIVLIQRKKLWITFKQHRQISVVSLFLVGIPASLFFASVPYAPVSVLILMWSTTPIFTAIFNRNGVGEVRGWMLMASLVVGSIGILIVLLGHVP